MWKSFGTRFTMCITDTRRNLNFKFTEPTSKFFFCEHSKSHFIYLFTRKTETCNFRCLSFGQCRRTCLPDSCRWRNALLVFSIPGMSWVYNTKSRQHEVRRDLGGFCVASCLVPYWPRYLFASFCLDETSHGFSFKNAKKLTSYWKISLKSGPGIVLN